MKFSLSFPGRVLFGTGVRHDLAALLPPGPVLIVCGKHSSSRIENEFIPELSGRPSSVCAGISPEPTVDEVDRVVAAARRAGAQTIIGWGGGSAIDTAKAAAALPAKAAPCVEYLLGHLKPPRRSRFFAAVSTTAGTGAEVTPNAVLRDPVSGIKQSLRCGNMFADIAVADPELTYDCPPEVAAASGFDALTQAIEGYLSLRANVVSRALAVKGAKKIFANLEAAVAGDHAARDLVSEGCLLGSLGFISSGLGAVHGIGHPLGSVLHLPHGSVCATLLAPVLRRNLDVARDEVTSIGAALGFYNPVKLIDAIEALRDKVGLPGDFRKAGLRPGLYDFIVANCRSGSMKSNPYEFSDDDVRSLLESLS
ncbi:MAG: iron-containing alcohol dehydrogenase [Victivallaceae bacterium]|nr:iron-containing alcohol dehydrogenase [Victivallaceae bacterium]